MSDNLQKKLAAGLSITSNAAIILLKLIAGVVSGSISIISEAIHSLIDFLASVMTFFAVMKSSEPADKEHPFGHGRYEDMSGFIEGGLIIFAGFYIIYEAVKNFLTGSKMDTDSYLGIIVMGIAVVANFFVSSFLLKVAKKTNSISLYADGNHLRAEIWSSLGVLIGLVLIKYTGILILDPIIALIVAAMILKTGFSISKTTLNNLLDGSVSDEEIAKITNILKAFEKEGVSGFKDLKARNMGSSKGIEFTILFPDDMTIAKCHDFCDEIEFKLKNELGECCISIHAEPQSVIKAS